MLNFPGTDGMIGRSTWDLFTVLIFKTGFLLLKLKMGSSLPGLETLVTLLIKYWSSDLKVRCFFEISAVTKAH